MSDPLSEVIGEDTSKTSQADTYSGVNRHGLPHGMVHCTLCGAHTVLLVATINAAWDIHLCTSCALALAHHVLNAPHGIPLHYFSESNQDILVAHMIKRWE